MTNKPNWQSELRDRMLEAADLGGDIYCVKAVDIATAFIQDLLDQKLDEAVEMQDEAYTKGYGDALKIIDQKAREIKKAKEDVKATKSEYEYQRAVNRNLGLDQAISILKDNHES